MKDNLPPDSNPQNLASRESGIIKTERQLLIEAEQKIGQMENERRLGIQHIEELKWLVASARSGVAALATHFNLTPADVKVIYDEYCARENAKILKQNEEAKKAFVDNLKSGKKVEFEATERAFDSQVDAPLAPDGAPDTQAKPEDN